MQAQPTLATARSVCDRFAYLRRPIAVRHLLRLAWGCRCLPASCQSLVFVTNPACSQLLRSLPVLLPASNSGLFTGARLCNVSRKVAGTCFVNFWSRRRAAASWQSVSFCSAAETTSRCTSVLPSGHLKSTCRSLVFSFQAQRARE